MSPGIRRLVPLKPRPLRPSKPSSTSVGTAYEQHTLKFLQAPPLSLQGLIRVGGAGDKGVDLRGWWRPPPTTAQESDPPRTKPRWSVVVQCKAESRRLGPGVVRELEGVAGYELPLPGSSASPSARNETIPTVAFLVALSGFSDEAHRRAAASRVPISLIHLPHVDLVEDALSRQAGARRPLAVGRSLAEDVTATSVSLNPALRELLGAALDVHVRRQSENGRAQVEIVWKGS